MTAPVLMNQEDGSDNWTMSFVLPKSFDFETAPRPTEPQVSLNRASDQIVATIRFSGFLRSANAQKHLRKLEDCLAESVYIATGNYTTAGYNPPWTLPGLRRNEVMIPVTRSWL